MTISIWKYPTTILVSRIGDINLQLVAVASQRNFAASDEPMCASNPLRDFVRGCRFRALLRLAENTFQSHSVLSWHARPTSSSNPRMSTVSHWSVALLALPAHQFEKTRSGLPLRWKHLALLATALTNPAPGADNSYLSKQGRLDRQGVVACHVLARIDALAIKLKPIVKHVGQNRRPASRRPTRLMNRWGTTDSFS